MAAALSLATTRPADIVFVALVEDGVGPVAVWLLQAAGFAADFVGNSISDPSGTAAVVVTRACDGHGLMAVLLGILIGWSVRTTALWRLALAFVCAVIVIIAFNTVRIAALFALRGGEAVIYEVTHEIIFAIGSVWLVALLAALAEDAGTRREPFLTPAEALRFAVALVAAAIVWIAFGTLLIERAATPLLNAILAELGPAGAGAIGMSSGHGVVNTMLVAAPDPLGLVSQPFDPAPFLLPLPVAVAAMLAAGRRPFVAAAIVLTVAAVGLLTAWLAMVAGIAHEAARLGVSQMAEMTGPQQVRLVPSRFPDADLATWLDRIRNVLVHVNLFILPLMIFPLTRRSRRRFSGYPQYVGTPQGEGARGAGSRSMQPGRA